MIPNPIGVDDRDWTARADFEAVGLAAIDPPLADQIELLEAIL